MEGTVAITDFGRYDLLRQLKGIESNGLYSVAVTNENKYLK